MIASLMSCQGDAVPNFSLTKSYFLFQSLLVTSPHSLIMDVYNLLVLETDASVLASSLPIELMQ